MLISRTFNCMVATAAIVAPAAAAVGLLALCSTAVLAASPGSHCEALARASLAGVQVTSATPVRPGPDWKPAPEARPAVVSAPFCRVQGVIDGTIGFELWLPQPTAWNGKFLGAGVGGDAGAFNFLDLPRGVAQGYASATTDAGHKAADRNWMLGGGQSLTNFELRANHRLAQVGQALTRAYYQRPLRHAYFIGCSGGGRQALKESQRFPTDYDGIIAGAPGPDTPEMTVRRMWELLLRGQHPDLMSAADWQHVADAAVKSCDRLDGVVDGVIADPRRCDFDPASLACPPAGKAGNSPACLSPAQLSLVKEIYAPLHDEAGHMLDAGLLPGILVDSGHSRLAPAVLGQAVRGQSNWDGAGFAVGADLAAINRALPELRADDPDLRSFAAHGGKLIIYQGWNDPAVAARMTVSYYDAVVHRIGTAGADSFLRLFMVPGMGHCGGGPGTDRFGGSGAAAPSVDAQHDMLAALDAWVTRGRAPERMIASRIQDGRVVRTRPLCAYPQAAHYTGGNSDSASSFVCRAPAGH